MSLYVAAHILELKFPRKMLRGFAPPEHGLDIAASGEQRPDWQFNIDYPSTISTISGAGSLGNTSKEMVMPKRTVFGSAKSAYGIMMDDEDVWLNYSLPEYRGEPFDTTVQKGDVVTVTYHEQEKKDGTLKTYVSTIGKVTRGRKAQPDDEVPFEDNAWEGTEAQEQPSGARQGRVSPHDAIMAKEKPLKVTGELS